MTDVGTIVIILIIANIGFSYKGFKDSSFFDRYMFQVDKILLNRDYKRLISSGFLHVGWAHLIFNMISLYAFSGTIETELGAIKFLVIYVASLVGGDLFSLFVHRHHGDYSSVGASGAVCGIIFASVALFPGMGVGFFGIPFSIPGWLYGALFVLWSIYGIKSKRNNIGHEAHLGGALVGMIIALLMEPSAFVENYVTILVIAVPTILFIYFIITKPHLLLVDNLFFRNHKDFYSVDHKYNSEKNLQQKQVDKILDKISKSGMNSLSKKERATLKEYSRSGR